MNDYVVTPDGNIIPLGQCKVIRIKDNKPRTVRVVVAEDITKADIPEDIVDFEL